MTEDTKAMCDIRGLKKKSQNKLQLQWRECIIEM